MNLLRSTLTKLCNRTIWMTFFLLVLFSCASFAQNFDHGLLIDEERRIVSFPGVVQVDRGWVQFLVAARGYPWIEASSAIVTEVPLKEIQQAIAGLDWVLWDQLWVEYHRTSDIALLIRSGDTSYPAAELAAAEDVDALVDLFFVGCPYFDPIALSSAAAECSACPLFPLEQRALEAKFTRESGALGYLLRESRMPAVGSLVWIEIQLPE